MANTHPKTLDNLIEDIHIEYEGDTETPTSSDEEYTQYTRLANHMIDDWDSQAPEEGWPELWESSSVITIVEGQTAYALSGMSDFRRAAGFARFTPLGAPATTYTRYNIIKPFEMEKYPNGVRAVYLDGNESTGRFLNLGWTPTAGDGTVGGTIRFKYYKYPTKLASGTDKPDMSRPMYIVHRVVAKLFQNESLVDFNQHTKEAKDLLDAMRAEAMLNPHYQHNSVEDVDADVYGQVMGV